MLSITEGSLTFQFPEGWHVTKFDEWSFYRNQFQKVCGGSKAVDILAIDPNRCVWIIEVKDYRHHPRTRISDVTEKVAYKVRDSLAALVAARVNANDVGEKDFSKKALNCKDIKAVLHLEQPAIQSKLYPRPIDPSLVLQKLKQLLKAIDPHPKVLEKGHPGHMAWSVT